MSGKELAEAWKGALPAARRRFKENVTGEEEVTEERVTYVVDVTAVGASGLEESRSELLDLYDTHGLRTELRTTAGRLVEVRHAVLQAQQAYKQAQDGYAALELSYKLEWRESDQARDPDPTTGKVNQAWVGLCEDAALLRASHLISARLELAELEREWRATQAEFEGLQDLFTALRHVARLTSAELAYLAGGGG